MLFNETSFIGIDPNAGKWPMAFTALDRELRLLAFDNGDLDSITAFVAGQQSAFVAIASPRKPNQGLMKKARIRESLKPVPRPGRYQGYRVAEYHLRQHNIHTMRTFSDVNKCPRWMKTGFKLYQRLESMGSYDYPSGKKSPQIMETYPHAVYSVLLGLSPYPKTSMEGRIQRQLVLHNQGLDIPDPMRIFEEITRYRILKGMLELEGLYSTPMLDALASAFTAWMAATSPDEVTILGHPDEGQIILPVPKILPKY
jgi:hypothetical protein